MPETLTYSAAFMIGLLGSAHCVGMCGGIMGALVYAVPAQKRTPAKLLPLLLSYNLGRILSYTLAGAIIGLTSWFLAGQFPQLGTVLRLIAALMLVAMGLYLANWWPVLRHLEKAGSRVWKHIQPVLSRLMPVKSPLRALLVGTLWGWIPCGLIYSTLTWAATAGQWQESALIMLFFGLGTLPAVLATGLLLERIKKLLQNRGVRSAAGLLVMLFGLWTLPLHSLTGSHSAHSHSAEHEMPMSPPATEQAPEEMSMPQSMEEHHHPSMEMPETHQPSTSDHDMHMEKQ